MTNKNLLLEEEIIHVNESARSGRHGQIIYLAIVALGYLLLFSITHRHLMLNTGVHLPLIGLKIPLHLFFVVAPPFLLLVYFAILQQHVVLAGKLEKLRRHQAFCHDKFETLLSSYYFVQYRLGPSRGLLFHFILWLRYWLVFFGLPAMLFVLFLWRFLAYHDEVISWWHRICLWLAILQMWVFAYYLHNPHGSIFKWREWFKWSNWYDWLINRRWPSCTTAFSRIAGNVVIFLSLFLNVPHDSISGKGWLEAQLLKTYFCYPVEVFSEKFGSLANPGGITRRKVCWLSAVLTERSPVYFLRNLVVSDQDLVIDKKWEPEKEASLRLRKRDFRYADFSNSDLHRADFSGADLLGANLSGANLRGSNFSSYETRLIGAELSYAYLQGADLSKAHIEDANLSNARMQGADLSYAHLDNADLSFAWLQGADLYHASLKNASLSLAHLEGADLSMAKLYGTYMPGANLQGADLSWTMLLGALLSTANLQAVDLSFARLHGSDLYDIKFKDTWFGKASLWKTTYPFPKKGYNIPWNIYLSGKLYIIEKWELEKFKSIDGIRTALPLTLLDSQLLRQWKFTSEYYLWKRHTSEMSVKIRYKLLHKHGKTRAQYLCTFARDEDVRKKIWGYAFVKPSHLFKGDEEIAIQAAWSEAGKYTAAYAWKLCPELITNNQIRLIFSILSKKLLSMRLKSTASCKTLPTKSQ